MGKTINTLDHQYYLVNEEKRQLFVLMTDEFIISRAMTGKISEKKFTVEDCEFLVVGEVKQATTNRDLLIGYITVLRTMTILSLIQM